MCSVKYKKKEEEMMKNWDSYKCVLGKHDYLIASRLECYDRKEDYPFDLEISICSRCGKIHAEVIPIE